MTSPLCYVIILNWNGFSHLEDCLAAVSNTHYENHRVLFVDNNSSDKSVEYVRRNYPSIEILKLNKNFGFAEGNNWGIRYALDQNAVYMALLNNDTRVETNWLDYLIETAEQNPKIALCDGQQMTWDGQQMIHITLRPDWLEGEMQLIPASNQHFLPGPTGFASGCCVLMRGSAIKEIGMFDSRYFAYVEDVDLSLRAWIAGYSVFRVPGSIVYHRGGVSSDSITKMKLGYRNQLLTMFKDYEISTLLQFRKSIFTRWVMTHNRYALLGMVDAIRSFPGTWILRNKIQECRKRSDESIFHEAGLPGYRN